MSHKNDRIIQTWRLLSTAINPIDIFVISATKSSTTDSFSHLLYSASDTNTLAETYTVPDYNVSSSFWKIHNCMLDTDLTWPSANNK